VDAPDESSAEFTGPIATILCSVKDTSATACVWRTAPSFENSRASKLVPGFAENIDRAADF
jgi:hypothetical protein